MKLLMYTCREQQYIFILPSDDVVKKLFELLSIDVDVYSTEHLTNMHDLLKLNGITYEIWDLNQCNTSQGYYIPEHTFTTQWKG